MRFTGIKRRWLVSGMLVAIVLLGGCTYFVWQKHNNNKKALQTSKSNGEVINNLTDLDQAKVNDAAKAIYDRTAGLTTTASFEAKFASNEREVALMSLLTRLVYVDKNYTVATTFIKYGQDHYAATAATIKFAILGFLAAKGTHNDADATKYRQQAETILKSQGALKQDASLPDTYFGGGE